MKVNSKRAFICICLLFSAVICVAQGSTGARTVTATSQINVRIPSVAIITLADNKSSSVVPHKVSPDVKKQVQSESSRANVVSNRKWLVNVSKEEHISYASVITPPKSMNASISPSVTIIYVTTLN